LLLEDNFNSIPIKERTELIKNIFSYIPQSTIIAISNDENLKEIFDKQIILTPA
jgi:hypothetical protein